MEQVLLFAIGGNGCFVQLNKDFGRNKTILINVEKADQERYVSGTLGLWPGTPSSQP